MTHYTNTGNPIDFPKKKEIPMLEKFAAQSLVEYDGELIFSKEKFAELIVRECIDKITTYDLVPGHSAKWEDIYDIHTRLLQDLGEELKEHFGVRK